MERAPWLGRSPMRTFLAAMLLVAFAPIAAADPVCLPDDVACAPVDLRDQHYAVTAGGASAEAGSYDGGAFEGTAVRAGAGGARVVYEQGHVYGHDYTLLQVFATPTFHVVSYYHNDDSGQLGRGFTCVGVAGNLDGGLVSGCRRIP